MNFKKQLKKVTAITLVLSGFLIPASAFATERAIHDFRYTFKHQLTIGYNKATTSKLKVKPKTTSWGSSQYLIKIYDGNGKLINHNYVNRSNEKEFSYSVTKGKTYGVEFWKSTDEKYIKGTGVRTY
ncbi:MAG: hypothetical protein RRZ84_08875 [Romboutsia sp.]